MIVQCPQCQTKYNLDESKLSPEGSWVRCTKCSETFQAGLEQEAPAPQPAPAAKEPAMRKEDIGLDLAADQDDLLVADLGGDQGGGGGDLTADFGLEDGAAAKGRGPGVFFRVLFWLLALVIILGLLAVGGVVVADRLGYDHQVLDLARKVPYMDLLLTPKDGGGAKAQPGEIRMALANVRGSYRLNDKVGRLFVIQGQVENHHQDARSAVLVRGRLQDAQGQVARQAVVYAGPTFTPAELQQLSLEQMQARLASPKGPEGMAYMVAPQGTIPFMIIFANLPGNLAEFSAEVVGSEPVPTGAKTQ